ncbi:MAG: DUF1861 family protein [Lachnospiraceae bacterium]|nr:DUF1861 family protein [Lachnospiraceae bacterium]
MGVRELREAFERTYVHRESAVLRFLGVDGWDVYNCSIPFRAGGKRYLFGRVERRGEWMRSFVRLFEECGPDQWRLAPDSMIYQLEDPYIAQIGGEFVLGGTHVRMGAGKLDTYYGYFYRGKEIRDLYYFTTGPDYMKDIRLVELADGKIGVFSRPRNEEIMARYGSESMLGFTVIDSLDQLSAEAVEKAPYIPGLFGEGEWGGCNQAYLLESGKIGVIGHGSYPGEKDREPVAVYMNISFVMDPRSRAVEDLRVIGTRDSYPQGPAKMPNLTDCAFTSGIVMRKDGMADLYSGIGDCMEGRVVIPYPFEGHGAIVNAKDF